VSQQPVRTGVLVVLVAIGVVALLLLSSRGRDDAGSAAVPAAVATGGDVAPLPAPSARPAPVEELAAEPMPPVATGAAATGSRLGRIEVLVRDEKRAPVGGYALRAVTKGLGSAPRQTDASGQATWEDVAPGTWTVGPDVLIQLGDVGVQPTQVNTVFTVLGDSEAVLQVEAGATARHVLEVVRRAHVVVRLSEIPNEAELEELTLTHDFEVQTRRLHSAIEGTKGATEIAWTVAPGESVLSARWAASSWSWSRPLLLDLQPGETREVALVPLSVQVTWGGRVVDTAGQPVGGVVTSITVRDRGLTGHGHQALLDVLAEKRVSSADDGSWALSVPAGASTLAVDTTDGRGRYLAPYDVDTELRDPSRPIEIVVASACVVTAAIEAWPPKPPTGGESPRWTLRLRRQTGPFTWSNPREWQSRQLEGERSFTFSPMAAGRYELELSMAGTLCAAQHFDVAPGFREGDRIRIALDFSR
jgi:hypothetical protein